MEVAAEPGSVCPDTDLVLQAGGAVVPVCGASAQPGLGQRRGLAGLHADFPF